MSTNMTLAVALTLQDRLTGGLRTATAQLDKMAAAGQRLQAMSQRLGEFGRAAIGVGAAMVATMAKPIQAFADSENAATKLKVSLMDSSGRVADAFEQINAKAEEMGNRLPGTTAEFQNMMTMLVRQGIDAQNILGGTAEAAGQLAVMLEMGKPAAAEFMAKLQDATKTTAKDMVALADTIQRVFYLGVDPGNMLQAFSALGPGMTAIRQTGLEGAKAMAPLIAMLDQAGQVGAEAGGNLSKALSLTFQQKGVDDANQMMRLKGQKTTLKFIAKGEFVGIENFITQLEQLKTLDSQSRLAVLEQIFGNDQQTNALLNTIIDKGLAGYRDVAAKMKAQADIQKRIDLQLGTLANLWDAASGTFVSATAAFAGTIGPELKALTQWFGDLSAKINAWVKANPNWAKLAAEVTLFGGAATIAGGAAALALAGVLKMAKLLLSPLGLIGRLMGSIGGKKIAEGLAGAAGDLAGKVGKGVVPVYVTNWGGQGGDGVDLPDQPGRPDQGPAKKKGLVRKVAEGSLSFGAGMAGGLLAREVLPTTWVDGLDRDITRLMAKLGSQTAQLSLDIEAKRQRVDSARAARGQVQFTPGMLPSGPAAKPAPITPTTGLSLGPPIQTLTTAADTSRQAAETLGRSADVSTRAAGEMDQAGVKQIAAAGAFQAAAQQAATALGTPITGLIRIEVTGPGRVQSVTKTSGGVDLSATETGGLAAGL